METSILNLLSIFILTNTDFERERERDDVANTIVRERFGEDDDDDDDDA